MRTTRVSPQAQPGLRWSRSARLAISVGVSISSFLLALLLGEVLVRFVAPQQLIVAPIGIYRPDRVSGWRHRERLETVVNTGEGDVLFQTDHNGYRIAKELLPPTQIGEVTKRVLTIGDSFLEAAAVDAGSTISSILASELSRDLGQRVVVDNDSAAGWDPNQYLFAARRALERNHYGLAFVFLYIGNDITSSKVDRYLPEQVARRHDFRIPLRLSRAEFIDSIFYPINDRLEASSHLFVFAKNRLQLPLAKLGLTAMYFPSIFFKSERSSHAWIVTSEICQDIDRILNRHGTQTVFVLIPTPYQVDSGAFQDYVNALALDAASIDLDQPNTILGKLFSEKSLCLVDPLSELRTRRMSGFQLYGTVDRHFNEEGHRALTDILLPVARSLLQEKPTS